MRLLRKTGETYGILGKSILKNYNWALLFFMERPVFLFVFPFTFLF